jgi:hypothetical protein
LSQILFNLIKDEMTMGPMHTFHERLHKKLAKHFAEIKSEALREIVGGMRKELNEAKAELEHRQTVINTLTKQIKDLQTARTKS